MKWLAAGFAVMVLTASPAFADTQVVGDSLTAQTYESGGWFVNARNGRTLSFALPLVNRFAARQPDALVVALGSNDVSQQLPSRIGEINPVPCLVLTTVKVYGVTRLYGRHWVGTARRWNRGVWQSGAVVANWNKVARAHPGYFLHDGLHLTERGERAYDRLLRSTVAAGCP